jgi:hypothetical protein
VTGISAKTVTIQRWRQAQAICARQPWLDGRGRIPKAIDPGLSMHGNLQCVNVNALQHAMPRPFISTYIFQINSLT